MKVHQETIFVALKTRQDLPNCTKTYFDQERSLNNDNIRLLKACKSNILLQMCDAHQYGWTLTPNVNNEIPTNFIEWVLFEGQLLRDGQRVFRELKIYDDWSVSIHAMGKKVHPDELGGITDLSRTKKSVAKVVNHLLSLACLRRTYGATLPFTLAFTEIL